MNLLVQRGINSKLVWQAHKSPCIAGRLALFRDNWQLITTDQWVLNTIQGYGIEFTTHPVQHHPPRKAVPSTQESLLLEEKIQKLLTKGAVVEVPNTNKAEGFYSSLFLVQKKGGGLRPIISLMEPYRNLIVSYRASLLQTSSGMVCWVCIGRHRYFAAVIYVTVIHSFYFLHLSLLIPCAFFHQSSRALLLPVHASCAPILARLPAVIILH